MSRSAGPQPEAGTAPDGAVTVVLPIPHPKLSPNGSHGHYLAVAPLRRQHRFWAYVAAREVLGKSFPLWGGRIWLDVRWVVPNPTWFPDDDNGASRLKAYRDGVGDAGLFINDQQVRLRDFTCVKGSSARVELTFEHEDMVK